MDSDETQLSVEGNELALSTPQSLESEDFESQSHPEMAQATVKLAEMTEKRLSSKKRAESSFVKALKEFHAEQNKIIKASESMVPKVCNSCSSVVQAKKDVYSLESNGSCFSCHAETQSHKTEELLTSMKAESFGLIATMDLSDYEDWLFGDEMGQRTLARILAKLKSHGYEYKPWQVSIGAAAWSKENYHDTDLVDTRHIVERVKIADLLDYIPINTDGIQQVIESVKRAETFMAPQYSEPKNVLVPLLGLAGLAIAIPLWLNRG